MRNLLALGIVLILLGIGGLLIGNFSYTETKPVLDAGPIHVTTQEQHRVSIPMIAGIVMLAAGIGMIIIGRRAA
jgi:xanthosine utilization system XapX-like protein